MVGGESSVSERGGGLAKSDEYDGQGSAEKWPDGNRGWGQSAKKHATKSYDFEFGLLSRHN